MENLGTSIFAAAIVILVLLLIMGIVLLIVNLKKTKAKNSSLRIFTPILPRVNASCLPVACMEQLPRLVQMWSRSR